MKGVRGIIKLGSLIVLATLVIWGVFVQKGHITLSGLGEFLANSAVYSFLLTAVNSYYYQWLTKKYPWDKKPRKRLWYGAIGSLLLTLLAFGLIRLMFGTLVYGQTLEEFVASERAANYLYALLITLIASLSMHVFYFYKALQETKVKEQKIIAGTATAQFDALKNQLDPHFLFNSLNVLTSLIEEDQDRAQDFTTSLSKVYRYVLEQKNKELVSVDEELMFARTYVKLLKMRFEDSIVFHIPERASSEEAKVVPLSLQLLLENAVKHNAVGENNPLQIVIEEMEGALVVRNNLQPKQVVRKSSGVGLQNIKQRYALLTHREVDVVQGATTFEVHLPVLTKQAGTIKNNVKMEKDNLYLKARKKVTDLKEFYTGLILYCIVIPFLIFVNYMTFWGFKWFWFPMFGWGIGLIFQAYKVYYSNGFLGSSWEDKKIKQFMDEEDRRHNWE